MYPSAHPVHVIDKEKFVTPSREHGKHCRGERMAKNDLRSIENSGIPVSRAVMSFVHILHLFPNLPEIP